MSASVKIKTLSIDGRPVSARGDETVLQVARENGIFIPTLCHLDGLSSVGACRMCIVEVKGQSKLFPACITEVWEGMEVVTDSERIRKYRKQILELIFAERNHTCSVCVSNGHCDLQYLAQKLEIEHIHFPYRFPKVGVDASHEMFVLDHNRCILCSRCVRICGEIEGAHTWNITGRGEDCRVITDLNMPWGDSETCTSCGKCVQVCPTGALAQKGKSPNEMFKRQGFLPYITLMREEHSHE